MAAVLRAIREIQPGESIRYQHVDHSEQIGNTPKCECCLHIGLCQPQEKETMLERMALVPTQSFSETWQPKIGAPVTVYTGGDAQKWRVNHIKKGIGTLITIEFENSEMIVDKSWFMFDTNLGSLVLQRLGFFSDIALKRTTNSIEKPRGRRRHPARRLPGSGGGHPGLGSLRTPPGQRHKNPIGQYKPTTLKPHM
jgi:hypothetical protein